MKPWIVAVLLIGLSACGASTSDSEPDESPKPTSLQLGQIDRQNGVDTKLYQVDYPYTGDKKHVAPDGSVFVGLNIRTCVDDDHASIIAPSNSNWTLVAEDGTTFRGVDSSSWSDWPAPKYPEKSTLQPGQCARGWILLLVGGDSTFTRVEFRPKGGTFAAWTGTFPRD